MSYAVFIQKKIFISFITILVFVAPFVLFAQGDKNENVGIEREGGIINATINISTESAAGSEDKAREDFVITGNIRISEDLLVKGLDTSSRALQNILFVGVPIVLGILILGSFLLFLVASIALVLLFPKFSNTLGKHTISNFGREFIRGAVISFIVPVALLLLLVSIVGIPLMLVGSLAYALLIGIAKLYTGIVFGGILAKVFKKEVIINWQWAALGILFLHFLILVPFKYLGTCLK